MDKREATLDQVQRDTKRAMDYISDDLQEAVYVYGDPAQIQRIYDELENDPKFPDSAVPVLAFWRIDSLVPPNNCSSLAAEKQDLCEILKIKQSAYTLVVYSQQANDGNDNWPGESRLIRYELSRFNASGLLTLTERVGYRDPSNLADNNASFESWIADTDGTPAGDSAVLVDYISTPISTFNRAPLSDIDAGGSSSPCSSYGTVGGVQLYSIVPSNADTSVNNSFFACIRTSNGSVLNTRVNQDVYVFLRGSVRGASGGVGFFSEESSLPILETRVLVKGIIDKDI